MAESSTSAPAPSQHVFLSDLPNTEVGAKVRFLCCIQYIDESKGSLEVEHRYPKDTGMIPKVAIDYDLVRGTVKRDAIEIGSWINVIGYVRTVGTDHGDHSDKRVLSTRVEVDVQAVLIWSAGAVRVSEYEATLEQQKRFRAVQRLAN